MRFGALYSRNHKELLRDPISLLFGIGLPVLLLLLISLIQKSMPAIPNIFNIENFAPGIAMFSLSFISLFSGMLLANDRSSSFLTRLFASPLTASDYIIAYTIPLIPIALIQSAVCFATAIFLGLPINVNVLFAIIALIPVAILFIGIGLLLGTLLSNKQVGPISSIVVQVAALSSGMWFDLEQIGGIFKKMCYSLPFAHAIDAVRFTLGGNYSQLVTPLSWVMAYTVVVFVVAITVFRRRLVS